MFWRALVTALPRTDWRSLFPFFPFCFFFTAYLFYQLLFLRLFFLHPFFNPSKRAGKPGRTRTDPDYSLLLPYRISYVEVFDHQLAGLRTKFIRPSLTMRWGYFIMYKNRLRASSLGLGVPRRTEDTAPIDN